MISPSRTEILARMRYDLDFRVMPELQTDYVRSLVTHMSELLRLLAVDEDEMARIDSDFHDQSERICAQANAGGSEEGSLSATPIAEVAERAEQLVGSLALRDDPQARGWDRGLIAAEIDLFARHRDAALKQIDRDNTRFADPQPVTINAVQSYLSARYPSQPSLRVVELSQVAGGWSKDTFIADITGWDGASRIVIRKDVPASTTEAKVADEAKIFEALEKVNFPAPRALWLELSSEPLGQPFLVVDHLEGKAEIMPAWRDDPVVVRTASLDFARILARLHSIPLEAVGYPIGEFGGDTSALVHAMVDHWHDVWRRNHHLASPTLRRAFAWLKDNVPQGDGRMAFVHGDAGWHNVLVHNGAITGLLDWEFAHPGDPAEDISYVRRFIEPMINWQDFMDAYVEAGGALERPDAASWYEVWRSVRNAVCCCLGQSAFTSGINPQFKFNVVGVSLYRKFILDVAANLQRVGA